LLQLIQLSKYEIKIQMDFNVIDSVINAVFFAQEKTVSGVVSDSSELYLVQMYQSKAVQEVHRQT
jgi:hypothetical protein